MKIIIRDYKTGETVWRGEIDKHTWAKYQREADPQTGACRSSVFLDQGLLTGQVPPPVIYAEEV